MGQLASSTANKYELKLEYAIRDGKPFRQLTPSLPTNYPILLLSSNGENLLLDENEVNFDEHPRFQWAKETYAKLRADIKELESHPTEEGSIWTLFQAQEGVLVLCETGHINIKNLAYFGALRHTELSEDTGGTTSVDLPIISINSHSPLFSDKDRKKKTLAHELSHNACHFLGIDFANSDLFRACVEVELAKGSSDTLRIVNMCLNNLMNEESYNRRQRYDELFARLQEERLI